MGPKMRHALDVMKSGKVYTTAELAEEGVDRKIVRRLKDADYIYPIARGKYVISDEYIEEEIEEDERALILEEFAMAMGHGGPESFICLYPAASWHDLGLDTSRARVTTGIPWSRGKPTAAPKRFTFIRWRQEEALTEGVEVAGSYRGVDVRITNKERTVVDLFRYSPLNPRQERLTTVVDEESAIEAINRYIASNDYAPAKLSRIAATFGVEHEINLFIKKASKDLEMEPMGMSMG